MITKWNLAQRVPPRYTISCSIKIEIKLYLFKPTDTEYDYISDYTWLFTENIGQAVRYIVIKKNSNEITVDNAPLCQKYVKPGQYFL